MDDPKQIDIKVFADQGQDINPYEFVPVLQRWIRDHTVPGVLIDVADYSHIRNGAGVILVGHEYNLSVDYTDGEMGLLFHSKLPPEGTLAERVASALRQAFSAAAALEEEGEFKARLAFNKTRFRFLASDRLHAPNTDEAYGQIAPIVEAETRKLTDDDVTRARATDNPTERLGIDVTASGGINVSALA